MCVCLSLYFCRFSESVGTIYVVVQVIRVSSCLGVCAGVSTCVAYGKCEGEKLQVCGLCICHAHARTHTSQGVSFQIGFSPLG